MKVIPLQYSLEVRSIMKKIGLLFLLIQTMTVAAVNVNHQGIGDVLLIPYYSVNNNLNTTVSVTNTTDQSKAIKINVREGLNGYAVLSYNVYLGAYDTWTFALVSIVSDVVGFEGHESAVLVSDDESCAPNLIKGGQNFLPAEFVDGPQGLSRSREGFLEVIEMGVLENEFAQAATAGTAGPFAGVPTDCNKFDTAWDEGGEWHNDSGGNPAQNLLPSTGGLMAEADVVNVIEGMVFSIPVVSLDGFFTAESISHVAPYDSSLSMDAAAPRATINANGQNFDLSFESGQDAVSAVLLANQLIGTYGVDAYIAGKAEAVFVQPTRRFYISEQGNNNTPPYNLNSNGLICPTLEGSYDLSQYGGTRVQWLVYSREAQIDFNGTVADPPPPRRFSAICDSLNVYQFVLPEFENYDNPAAITGSNNHQNQRPFYGFTSSNTTENGFFKLNFLATNPLIGADVNNGQEVKLMGIPVIGFTLHQYTNAGAAEGLLAQYGASHLMKSTVTVTVNEN